VNCFFLKKNLFFNNILMKKIFLLFLFSFFIFTVTKSQNIFHGQVISGDDKKPLQGVVISTGKKVIAVSDSLGNFELPTDSILYTISFSHVDYQTEYLYLPNNKKTVVELYHSNAFMIEVIVKAFERNAKIANIPVAVSVLNKKDLQRYNDESLVAPVNTIPGVKMDERSPGSYRLSIRGNLLRSPFGVRNVKIYWDGIPFTDANGNTYLQQIGLNNIGKIEVIKGSGGSMYGAGTDGVILLTSAIAEKSERSISLNSFGGSYGLFASNLTYSYGSNNSNEILSISHLQSDGYRQQTGMRRDVADFTGSYVINDKRSINTNIFYSDLYYQTPGGLTLAQMAANPRQARPSTPTIPGAIAQDATVYVKTFYAGLSHNYQFSSSWSNTTSIYTSDTRFSNPAIRNYERRSEQGVGGRTVMQYQDRFLKLNFGGEYQYTYTNTRTFGNKSGQIDTLQDDQEIDASIYNIFAQADISLAEDIIVNAGLSYNNYHYGFLQVNTLPASKISRDFNPELVPRISILKKIGANYSIYVTVSKGFSPPSIAEVVATDGIFNKTLNAEDGKNYELGVRGDIIKNKLSIDASAYLSGLNNTIVSRTDSTGAQHFVNEGKTDQKGVEAAVSYYPIHYDDHLFQTVKLWCSYTYIYARFKDYISDGVDYSGNKLPGTAPNVFILGADINTKPGIYGNFTYNYTDRIALNDANKFFASQYNLLSGRVGFKAKLSKLISSEIYATFNKSFNAPYSLGNDLNAAGNRFFNPSAPQTFSGGFKIKMLL